MANASVPPRAIRRRMKEPGLRGFIIRRSLRLFMNRPLQVSTFQADGHCVCHVGSIVPIGRGRCSVTTVMGGERRKIAEGPDARQDESEPLNPGSWDIRPG